MHNCKTAFAIEYFQICIIVVRFCLSICMYFRSAWIKNRFNYLFLMNPKCKQNLVESVYGTQPLSSLGFHESSFQILCQN